tara:strand:+ start:337 stop:1194 length:858 start_codon:yes stop_codon:yes gene_type:complete
MATFQPTTFIVRSLDSAAWEYETRDAEWTTSWNNYLNTIGATQTDQSVIHRFGQTSEKIHIDLKQPLHMPRGIRVNKSIVPHQMATFKDSNKTLKLYAQSLTTGSSAFYLTITMPTTVRYVTYAEVAAEIDTQLKTSSSLFSCAANSSGKLTISSASTSPYQLSVIEPNAKFGFDYGMVAVLRSTTAPAPVVLQPTRALYIRSRSFGVTSSHASNDATDLIAMMPYEEQIVGFGGASVYLNPNTQTYINIIPNIYNVLEFELLDDEMERVNLRRHHWQMELSFAY